MVRALGSRALLATTVALGVSLASAEEGPGAALSPPRWEELAQATYTGLSGNPGTVSLRDGRWEGEPLLAGGAARQEVTLARDFLVTGDLDGDGAPEAVVALVASGGGSGVFTDLVVARRTASGVAPLAVAALGDRVQLRFVRIEGGRLMAGVVRAGAEDGLCCPGEVADLAWRLQQGTLVENGPAVVRGRKSLELLGANDWVLRAWNPGEPAPVEPEITLAWNDGHLVGSSGCNLYSAPVEPGESTDRLKLGPIAATRRACVGPAAAVEARFTSALGRVDGWGYLLGRLALAYTSAEGARGTLLFEEHARPAL